MGEKRDWFDYAGTLLLPVVIATGGIAYTWHKDSVDSRRAEAQRNDDQARLAWERDAGYVKLLASSNDRERALGLQIIDVLSNERRFSADLVPVVAAIAAGRPSDPATQAAQRILNANPDKVAQAQTAAGKTASASAPVTVYLQIARGDQRDQAAALQADLHQAGFATPGIELVSNPTTNTYVRSFTKDPASVAKAQQIIDLMRARGISAALQDFSGGAKTPGRPIEVWIGKVQPSASQTGDAAA